MAGLNRREFFLLCAAGGGYVAALGSFERLSPETLETLNVGQCAFCGLSAYRAGSVAGLVGSTNRICWGCLTRSTLYFDSTSEWEEGSAANISLLASKVELEIASRNLGFPMANLMEDFQPPNRLLDLPIVSAAYVAGFVPVRMGIERAIVSVANPFSTEVVYDVLRPDIELAFLVSTLRDVRQYIAAAYPDVSLPGAPDPTDPKLISIVGINEASISARRIRFRPEDPLYGPCALCRSAVGKDEALPGHGVRVCRPCIDEARVLFAQVRGLV